MMESASTAAGAGALVRLESGGAAEAEPRTEERRSRQKRALGWLAVLFCAAAALALYPLAVPLLLAVWCASIVRPLHTRLVRALRGRNVAAALLVSAILVAMVAPTTVVLIELAHSATELATIIAKGDGAGHSRLRELVQDDGSTDRKSLGADASQLKKLAKDHGTATQELGKGVFIFTAAILIFLLIFGFGTFAVLAEGERCWAWALDHSPIEHGNLLRLGGAVQETGRGLLASIGVTAALQGVLCTTIYLALNVPRAWVLGFLTAIFSIMPVVGTPLVWGSIAIGLALSGETTKAVILLAVGGGVIALIENLVGPFFARLAKFQLPTFLLVASMFGGVFALGPAGILLGPLALRLAQEVLAVARDEGLVGAGRDDPRRRDDPTTNGYPPSPRSSTAAAVTVTGTTATNSAITSGPVSTGSKCRRTCSSRGSR